MATSLFGETMVTDHSSKVNTTHPSLTLRSIIEEAARAYSLDPALVNAVIRVESSFNPYAVSRKGAQGLMQIMPETADSLGIRNVFNPRENIFGGCKYLRKLLDDHNGNLRLALAAYNAGPTAVKEYGGIPPYRETRNYIRKVLTHYKGSGYIPTISVYKDKNNRMVISNVPRRRR